MSISSMSTWPGTPSPRALSERAAARATKSTRASAFRNWRAIVPEFTGSAVIPGEVDVDLFNEHMARYAFARGWRGVSACSMRAAARDTDSMRGSAFRNWRTILAEFTGERVIPGQVDVDLLNEHMARYAFAARLARGKRVLDAGCGAGYGSAELAQTAAERAGRRLSRRRRSTSRAPIIRLPNLRFEAGVVRRRCPSADASVRPGGGVRGDRAPGRLARLSAGSAARAGAHRAVHRLHAQQALLRRIARRAGRQSVPRSRIRFRGVPRRVEGGLPARFDVSGKSRGGRHVPAARSGQHGGGAGGCRGAGAGRIALLRGGVRAPAADRATRPSSMCRARPMCCASGSGTSALLEGELAHEERVAGKAQRDLAELDRGSILPQYRGRAGKEQPLGGGAEPGARGAARARRASCRASWRASRRTRARWRQHTRPRCASSKRTCRAKTQWAHDIETALKAADARSRRPSWRRRWRRCTQTEKELEERTAWAQRLEEGRRAELERTGQAGIGFALGEAGTQGRAGPASAGELTWRF